MITQITVHWIDSCGPSDWWREKEQVMRLKPTLFHTIGYLVAESPDFITVAGSVSTDGEEYGGIVCIPAVAIRSQHRKQVRFP